MLGDNDGWVHRVGGNDCVRNHLSVQRQQVTAVQEATSTSWRLLRFAGSALVLVGILLSHCGPSTLAEGLGE